MDRNSWIIHVLMQSDEAKEQYITLVESLKVKYGYDATKEPEAVGGGS
jgi:diazepam-binding inhibitor (GABA receptor modulating acyl-CoA-binding protein)